MELPFITLDVFTTTRYRGNPLAVVTIPADQPQPSQDQKQTIAREFNLSETVFVHDVDPNDSKADQTSRVIDIFTTDAEIPFAGHPTIGTAVSLIPKGVTTLIAKAGPIALTQNHPGYIQADIPHNVRHHQKTLADVASPIPGQLAADETLKSLELKAPLFSIVNGMTFALINLPDLEHLSRVKITGTGIPCKNLLDEGWDVSFLCKYYYVENSRREEEGTTVVSIRSRMIEGIFEDPATGSAACALSSYLSLQNSDGQDVKYRYEIDQGVEMGRESNIVVDLHAKDSKIQSVKLSGTATQVMKGHITI